MCLEDGAQVATCHGDLVATMECHSWKSLQWIPAGHAREWVGPQRENTEGKGSTGNTRNTESTEINTKKTESTEINTRST